MSILNQLQIHHPELQQLREANDFRAATAWLDSLAPDGLEEASGLLCDEAVNHWLKEAEDACRDGKRDRMNACLAEAARFRTPGNHALFREARRRLRAISLSFTTAPHWTELLQAASRQRRQYFQNGGGLPPSTYQTFENPKLLAALSITIDDLDGLGNADLSQHSATLVDAYPKELAPHIPKLGAPFWRAAIRIAGGRPDLAILDLLELPDTNPVVCLERARVSYALGFPTTAALALSDFTQLHGQHVVLRRLHTGVFMAQMANAGGDPQRAVAILESLPLDTIGRRPVLLLGRLLGELSRGADARALLDDWCHHHPDDAEARELLSTLGSTD